MASELAAEVMAMSPEFVQSTWDALNRRRCLGGLLEGVDGMGLGRFRDLLILVRLAFFWA